MNRDKAMYGIVAANVATVALALWDDWPLLLMLWPYWCQSVIIGWFARKRILALHDFSAGGFRINDQPVDATVPTKARVANFFALHYGGFHLIYLLFLVVLSGILVAGVVAPELVQAPADELAQAGRLRVYDPLLVLGLAACFWFSHRASHREHLTADLAHPPNIGTLMFLPYLRVVPMHLTIILAIPLGGAGGVLLFGTLKTVADVLMHRFEHRLLQKAKKPEAIVQVRE